MGGWVGGWVGDAAVSGGPFVVRARGQQRRQQDRVRRLVATRRLETERVRRRGSIESRG